MCDYSLHGIRNRLADEGETLVVHRFFTGSKGLTSPEYLKPIKKAEGFIATLKEMFGALPKECAVCIPDGARLVLHRIPPALRKTHGLCSTEPVKFRQLSLEADDYRDALEFKNGFKLRLQDLDEGQMLEVKALCSEESEVRNGSLEQNAR